MTIFAAGGNDTIDIVDGAKNTVIKYTAGDGSDLITLNETSTLSISGAPYTSVKSGNDWIIGVGSDSITLQGAAALSTVNIAGINSDDAGVTLRNYMNDTLITGTPNNDSIENGSYNGNVKGGNNVTIVSGDGDDNAYNMQGKNFTFTGGKGVNSVHSYQGNVATISTGANNDYFNAYQSMLLTVSGGAGNVGLHSGGGNHNSLNGDAGNDFLTLWNGETNSTILGGAGSDTLRDNGGSKNILDGGDGKDLIIINSTANDTVMLGAGDDTVKNSGSTATTYFVDSDGAGKNIITGATSGDTIFISGNSDAETLTSNGNLIVAAGKVTVTVDGGANRALTVKGCSSSATDDITDEEFVSITTLKLTDNSKSSVTLGSTYKTAGASALKRGIKILGNASANSIVGGNGNDTINGGGGNDTLTGGAGKDVFIYSGGKDVITDYASGDKIKLGAKINKATVSGKNVVFTTTAGTLKISGGKGKSLAIADAGIKTVDASSRKKALKLTGNALANSIKGGSGADTLNGGAGNDSLWGGAGKDTFIYGSGDGKDVIYGFENNDLLKITGAFSASYSKSKNSVAFKVGTGSVTLRDFGSTTLFHVNSTTYQLSGGKLRIK